MEQSLSHWPMWVLIIGIFTVIFGIAVLRIHAFLALIFAAVVVGILTIKLPGEYTNHYVRAVELSMVEFGSTAGKIAFVIALASILGVALTMSGAAEKIVIRLMKAFGQKLAPIALLSSGFILSIPVFFDTVFFLLIPIGYSMGKKIKKDYVLYVMAISAGAAITHSLVPPTPGPLLMAETLKLNLGFVILTGILFGILPAILAYLFSKKLSDRLQLKPAILEENRDEIPSSLPSFFLSVLPIVVPLILIMLASLAEYMEWVQNGIVTFIHFAGNKNVAMLIGTIIALWLLARQKQWGLRQVSGEMEKPLEIAGVIILITSAGGAFGGMIQYSGIGTWISGIASGGFEFNYILLAWCVAAVMKIAQGSGTVSMITSAGIMYSLIENVNLPYHPVYIYLAIGYGSMFITWMNDSGFWVVCKLSGFTERQTLQTWTVVLGFIALIGLVQVWLFSKFLPLI